MRWPAADGDLLAAASRQRRRQYGRGHLRGVDANPPGVFKSPPGRPWLRTVRRRAGAASAGRAGLRPIRSQHLLHDLAQTVADIPEHLLLPLWSGRVPPQGDAKMSLTIEGVAACDGSHEDINLFPRTLRWIAKKELSHEPDPSAE